MEIVQEKTLQIKVSGENVDILKSAIKKISDDCKQVRLGVAMLNPDERKVIDEIREKL